MAGTSSSCLGLAARVCGGGRAGTEQGDGGVPDVQPPPAVQGCPSLEEMCLWHVKILHIVCRCSEEGEGLSGDVCCWAEMAFPFF